MNKKMSSPWLHWLSDLPNHFVQYQLRHSHQFIKIFAIFDGLSFIAPLHLVSLKFPILRLNQESGHFYNLNRIFGNCLTGQA